MTKFVLWVALIIVGFTAAALAVLHFPSVKVTAERAVIPGKLLQSHAFLEDNCTACHTPAKGVEAKNCIVCHADNTFVLQREPSAFHANIGACAVCHLEHQGRAASMTKMDHAALARIGLKQLDAAPAAHDPAFAAIVAWLRTGDASPSSPHLQRPESLLNCAACHSTKDRHVGLFGTDCASCHGTAMWTIPEFRHPASASQSCAQCHQAPPSHYMGMFSMKIAARPHAQVSQCFLCHQTTSWRPR
jgi:hypothetical protein